MKLRGLVPNFYIRVSHLWELLYIPTIGLQTTANRRTDRSWEYINPSQIHECRNWERGSFISGNIGFEFSVQCRALTWTTMLDLKVSVPLDATCHPQQGSFCVPWCMAPRCTALSCMFCFPFDFIIQWRRLAPTLRTQYNRTICLFYLVYAFSFWVHIWTPLNKEDLASTPCKIGSRQNLPVLE